MNRLTRKITIALAALLAEATVAQNAGMTLNDCLLYAREHAFVNRMNSLDEESARANQRIAAGALLPIVGLSASGSMSFGRNIDPETNMYDNNRTVATGFGLNMSLPLFDGLVSINNLRAANAARRRQAAKTRADEDEISMEVIRAFYNVSYVRSLVGQMEEQLRRDEADLKATELNERLGTKSGADVAEMRAIVAADEYELANQRNLLAKAYLELRGHMGMELSDEPLELVEEDYTNGTAMHSNPRVDEARMSVREGIYSLRAARGAYSPRLSLSGSVTTSFFRMMGANASAGTSFGRQWRDNMGQYIGLSLTIPLFDGLVTPNRVKKARIDLDARRTRLEQVQYEVEKLTLQAGMDLQASRSELTAATRRVEAEEAAFNATRRRFELGSASAIDLYTSGTKLATARANLEGKRIQLIINEITAAYYAGHNLIRE
ncbi:MAG: TolC family protein [Muribaculaceae bacterium]|nr:TolC family protein [Muribaculaceae bacterium]